jgi:hypothetical protein
MYRDVLGYFCDLQEGSNVEAQKQQAVYTNSTPCAEVLLSPSDEYNHATIYCITLYMYSLLILIRAFHRKDVHSGYVATLI